MTTERQQFEVPLASGERLSVPVQEEIGSFILHRRVSNARVVQDGWAVTHKASGLRVWTTEALEQAQKVAHWLDEKKHIPAEEMECLYWRDALDPAELTRLIAELQEIAPRYDAPLFRS